MSHPLSPLQTGTFVSSHPHLCHHDIICNLEDSRVMSDPGNEATVQECASKNRTNVPPSTSSFPFVLCPCSLSSQWNKELLSPAPPWLTAPLSPGCPVKSHQQWTNERKAKIFFNLLTTRFTTRNLEVWKVHKCRKSTTYLQKNTGHTTQKCNLS